jgi:hypothetical protein
MILRSVHKMCKLSRLYLLMEAACICRKFSMKLLEEVQLLFVRRVYIKVFVLILYRTSITPPLRDWLNTTRTLHSLFNTVPTLHIQFKTFALRDRSNKLALRDRLTHLPYVIG